MPLERKRAERIPGRLLAVAAVLQIVAGAGVANAQTVMVRSAPPGSTIELLVNSKVAGSATADPAGDATLKSNLWS
jgi:hypothetical protein